ncbi:hypothetical protein ACWDG1_41120 [Streptomyces sp. NPDC001177]
MKEMESDSSFEMDEFLYAEAREDNTMSYSKGSSSCSNCWSTVGT